MQSSFNTGSEEKRTSWVVLNLGCGARTSPRCVNIDSSISVRLHRAKLAHFVAPLIMGRDRLKRFRSLDDVVACDLRKGLGFADGSVDAVYHSHVLEHLDRDRALDFVRDIRRVLRPEGIHRIVVPDLELACRAYLADLESCSRGEANWANHDDFVAEIIEQMVRREADGTSRQPQVRRLLENLLLGDARRRGETHQWMYDRVNLTALLEDASFKDVCVVDYATSAIDDWESMALDVREDGTEYKPGSLYIECRR